VADEIFFINVGEYIGESTHSEIVAKEMLDSLATLFHLGELSGRFSR
jgi:hypothetical protein